MHIHSNIRALRRKAGLTQKELSEQLDKTHITVGDYERGKALPPLTVILKICEIFSVDIGTLVHHDIENEGFATSDTSASGDIQALNDQLHTQQRINTLQEQRLAELEREIREHAPELGRRLGL